MRDGVRQPLAPLPGEVLPPAATVATVIEYSHRLTSGLALVSVLLLAPVWMQLLHLLAADALWIAFILLGTALGRPERRRTADAA